MKQNLSYLNTHFHKVESCTWLRVRTILQQMLLARLECAGECFIQKVSAADFETIRDFLEQMDTAYLHPRRDAAHLSLCQTLYGSMVISDRLAERVRYFNHCLTQKKKNLSQFSNQLAV